jgi:hypothetical protein
MDEIKDVSIKAYESRYGWISEGYVPPALVWHSVYDCLPNMTDRTIAGFLRSCQVLIFIANSYAVGFLEQDEKKEFPAYWKLSGRDSDVKIPCWCYVADEVTHWRWLPAPPIDKTDVKIPCWCEDR